MAIVTKVSKVDDLDGSGDAKTIQFALDGAAYEIDLSAKNANRLREALAPFISAARKSGTRRARRGAGASGMSRDHMAAVRTWARNNGHQVSDRGRLPAAVVAAFEAAH